MRGKRKRCELGRLLPSLTEARRGWGTVKVTVKFASAWAL